MKNVHKIFSPEKKGKEKISVVTCYDFSFARILNETEIDSILVGDSLGMVFQGNSSTLPVTLEEMIYHTKAVRRGAPDKFIVADLPFLSYQTSIEEGIRSAGKMMKETDCDAVKIEGGSDFICELVAILKQIGVPVMGHLGLTPQSVHVFGGHRIQGKGEESSAKLLREAVALAGAFSIVLEMIPADLGKKVSEQVGVPTIGIGAGPDCDGQVLVLNDLLGTDPNFQPKFLKKFSDLHSIVKDAVGTYNNEVKSGEFPGKDHSF
ncbi:MULTISPECIES: 3-methyl-2-oxobutanoate hydroxymethyltransferase [Leptospira]|uniref:3-methyl-2-oxobutanoate hydroxymethyltransferase n=4 Tax=Leptospira weilii TaxID=28184 RepID=A0A828Z1Z7_9LEPT|nr:MULTISPECIES: 3-methyl-2-oxobutanoate hydroxymethyltransferase [Leptospira]EMM71807.1 3-methyl-2-oxobutanoate hydroxymethyltransferase [Leptospira weilii str. 2006001855]EMY15331.1 3-methyl-2-oxobutanoate hydroxymethyltransferase [Leptospira weilii str. Ecochallenge]EKR65017.1 3-methyl-2-oxobutanoate hydroxymethyltransferase [Leptospira weilii str. 2006001853]EMJ63177.1 3-methyl-2-oxobutanoate hydroxymethyltransferase [Leptospira sp. P2653]EMN46273.1 3-methyl-2-oxobutanoate hydroxymethyltra